MMAKALVKKQGLAVAALLTAVLTAALILWRTQDKTHITIGVLTTASGRYASHGEECRQGVRLAIEEINASGGIRGTSLNAMEFEDEGLPNKALDGMRQFRHEGIQYVIGPFLSATGQAVAQYATEHQMVTMGPVVASHSLSGMDDYFFRLIPSVRTIGERTGELVLQSAPQRMDFVYDANNAEFGESFLRGIQHTLQHTPSVALTIHKTDPRNSTHSFRTLAQKISNNKPNALVMSLNPTDAAVLAQRVRALLPNVPFYAPPWTLARDLVETGGHAVLGLRGFLPSNDSAQTPAYLDFKNRFKKRFGHVPSFCALFYFDATKILSTILAKDPRPTPQIVKEALSGKRFATVQGEVALDNFGDAQREIFLHETTEQGFVHVRERGLPQ